MNYFHPRTCRIVTTMGQMTFRPVFSDPVLSDAELLHNWLTDPRAKFWESLDASLADVQQEYTRIAAAEAEQAWIISLDGEPVALTEIYDPSRAVLASLGIARAGDVGMHVLIAPRAGDPRHGLSDTIFSALMRWIFSDLDVQRVLVEPDAANTAVHKKNARAGFPQPGQTVTLGSKNALLQECSREQFVCSAVAPRSAEPVRVADVSHLMSAGEKANRELLAKAIREFVHERLLAPEQVEPGIYRVRFGSRVLRFAAREHALLHYSISPSSLTCEDDAQWQPDVVAVVADAAEQLGIPNNFLHTYLEEVAATVAARARRLALTGPTSAELADDSRDPVELFQAIESAMTGGHPGFLANSGRGGMGETQLRSWAPEMGGAAELIWCAARKSCATLAGAEDVDAQQVVLEEFPGFAEALESRGLDAEDYTPIPFHPWQWEQKMTTTFASDIAAGLLIPLGTSGELHRPQQSLRTFFNASRPERPYVKTAVAVRNMGFTRGLSATYMDTTPAVNDWLVGLLGSDEEFAGNGVSFLRETVTTAYVGSAYHRSAEAQGIEGSAHVKMTAALWRESPVQQLRGGETLSTAAGILHIDDHGTPLVAEWIKASGVSAAVWLDALLRVYLRPLAHALVAHGVVFMPHTENVILRLRGGLPIGAFHKDLGEEVAVVSQATELPEEIERIRADHGDFDDAQRALSIHTDVVDGVLRHLAAIMDDHGLLDEEVFWQRARACLKGYREDHPEFGNRIPLDAATFRHSCLNRLQLRNPETMVNLGDQESSLIYAGELDNPLHSGFSLSS